jgi:hypothetical protein
MLSSRVASTEAAAIAVARRLVGWAQCGATMGAGMKVTTVETRPDSSCSRRAVDLHGPVACLLSSAGVMVSTPHRRGVSWRRDRHGCLCRRTPS